MDKVKLTREELYDLVWAEPLLSLSKKYAISDVGLRKLCVRMNIPVPIAGHWSKIKAGKAVLPPELPNPWTGEKIGRISS